MTDLEQAKAILVEKNATCVFVKGNELFYRTERGVAPLLKLFNEKKSLAGFSAADKVIGKAAAFLYVLLEVENLYAKVISKHALEVLNFYNIPIKYDELVDAIRNRTDTGFCPMETAVLGVSEPEEAYRFIVKKLEELR